MESTQQKPRTLRQALNRGGKSESASGGPRRLSDYVTRRPKTLADIRRITSLLESSAAAKLTAHNTTNNPTNVTNTLNAHDSNPQNKSTCSATPEKPCGCKGCRGSSSLTDTSHYLDGIEFQKAPTSEKGKSEIERIKDDQENDPEPEEPTPTIRSKINPDGSIGKEIVDVPFEERQKYNRLHHEWLARKAQRDAQIEELERIQRELEKQKPRAAAAAAGNNDARDKEIEELERKDKNDTEPVEPKKSRPMIFPDGSRGMEEVPLTDEERREYERRKREWVARKAARDARLAELKRARAVHDSWVSAFDTNGDRRAPGPCVKGRRAAVLPVEAPADCLVPPTPDHSPCPPFTEDSTLSFCTFSVDGKCYKAIQAWYWDSISGCWIASGQVIYVGPFPCDDSAQKAGVIVITTDCEPLPDSELAELAKTGPSRHPKHTGDAEWATDLPDCPCDWNAVAKIKPDPVSGESKVVGARRGWCNEGPSRFHPGAVSCFRSLVPLDTFDVLRINPGQQCCYDENGELITGGAGAGTPDKAGMAYQSAANGDCMNDPEMALWHLMLDVAPFDKNSIEEYHKEWPPNKGHCCRDNPGLEDQE